DRPPESGQRSSPEDLRAVLGFQYPNFGAPMVRAILSSGGSGATSPASTLVAAGAEIWVTSAPFAIKTSPGSQLPLGIWS
ncbi:hypothetical protein, partial [Roseibium sp.]|uniref:hypothetical protein n=1 Tax=Roseibium sp. TaxID=1936156 RepID=UPI003298C21C